MMLAEQPLLTFHPVTKERWSDFEQLFGPNGAYAGCWCMWWRSKRSEFEERHWAGNRKAMKEIVDSGMVPGILAYQDGVPAAWCSVAPREHYGSLNRSPVLKRLDDTPVWSIVCFYVGKEYRKGGMLAALIRGAIEYVRDQGGKIVEAYPTVPKEGVRMPPVSSFMGLPSAFEKAGFVEVARPSKSKVILRYTIK
ncbi:MAG: GNAT family N-acetyltransferase [Chloroflexi bacterium]|nr:GNAT family N-acetyltransferase [Chloroflexota bacterium]